MLLRLNSLKTAMIEYCDRVLLNMSIYGWGADTVAFFKKDQFLERSGSEAFDADYRPGVEARHGGIYCCMGCGREIGIAAGEPLPAADHHPHSPEQGSIRWQLIVLPNERAIDDRISSASSSARRS